MFLAIEVSVCSNNEACILELRVFVTRCVFAGVVFNAEKECGLFSLVSSNDELKTNERIE